MAAPVVHFELHAEDPDRALAFYNNVFGWVHNDVPGMEQQYWLLYPNGVARRSPDEELDGPGIAGGLLRRRGPAPEDGQPLNAATIVLQVEDIIAAAESVEGNGGHIVVPTMEIAGVGQVFYAKDTEGNIIGVLEPASG